MITSNMKGFSLVSVMVAIGLASGLGLMLSKLQENSLKAVKSVESSNEVINTTSLLSKFISSKQICEYNFKGKKLNTTVFEIQDLEGKVLLGDSHNAHPNTVNSIRTNYIGNGLLELYLELQRPEKSYGARVVRKKIVLEAIVGKLNEQNEIENLGKLPLSEITDDHVISTCCCGMSGGGTGNDPKAMCESMMDGIWDDTIDPPKCKIGEVWRCLAEKQALSESQDGGKTTKCTPNEFVPGTHLYGGNKTREQCLEKGGTIDIVNHPLDASNKIVLCRLQVNSTSLKCPSGWSLFSWLSKPSPRNTSKSVSTDLGFARYSIASSPCNVTVGEVRPTCPSQYLDNVLYSTVIQKGYGSWGLYQNSSTNFYAPGSSPNSFQECTDCVTGAISCSYSDTMSFCDNGKSSATCQGLELNGQQKNQGTWHFKPCVLNFSEAACF